MGVLTCSAATYSDSARSPCGSAGSCHGALAFIQQPATALLAIRFSMGLLPAVLVICGLLVMRGWPDRGAHLQSTAG